MIRLQEKAVVVLFFEQEQLLKNLLVILGFQARVNEPRDLCDFDAGHVRVEVLESIRQLVGRLNCGHDRKLLDVWKSRVFDNNSLTIRLRLYLQPQSFGIPLQSRSRSIAYRRILLETAT